VLGTRADELERLGLQHRVWRAASSAAWGRAGITVGSRVLDAGAGPGYATIDLAEIVGPTGEVIAVERSPHFFQYAQNAARLRGLKNIKFRQADLMEESLGSLGCDAAWCRWVASFVSSPQQLIAEIAGALRPGGMAIFHEYIDYRSWRLAPARPILRSFVEEVMASWRASGGEPDVALNFPPLLEAAGLRVVHTQPHILLVRPNDYAWQWPASFIASNVDRLQELGRVTPEWGEQVRAAFDEASNDPTTWLLTPLFLEIIAQR
jgi:SAM-dependent methyltransferase